MRCQGLDPPATARRVKGRKVGEMDSPTHLDLLVLPSLVGWE